VPTTAQSTYLDKDNMHRALRHGPSLLHGTGPLSKNPVDQESALTLLLGFGHAWFPADGACCREALIADNIPSNVCITFNEGRWI